MVCCCARSASYTASTPTGVFWVSRNLDAFTCAKRFRFHQKFDIKQVDAFLTDLFSSDSVQRQLQVRGAGLLICRPVGFLLTLWTCGCRSWVPAKSLCPCLGARRALQRSAFPPQCLPWNSGTVARTTVCTCCHVLLPACFVRHALTQPGPDIVTPTGYIRKCMEDVFDGVTVGDELRRMFIDEDSEHVDLYVIL